MGARGRGLRWFILGADDHAAAAGNADIVAHRGSEIQRRNAIGRTSLNDPACIAGAAELIAEFRLVTIERDKFVAAKRLDCVRCRRWPVGSQEALHGSNLL